VTSDTPREARWTTSRQLFEFLGEKGKNWRKHCHKYGACKQPVYFVRDGWYNNVYVPGYQAKHEGKGHGKGHKDDRIPLPHGAAHRKATAGDHPAVRISLRWARGQRRALKEQAVVNRRTLIRNRSPLTAWGRCSSPTESFVPAAVVWA
jgi:hypothetical protein